MKTIQEKIVEECVAIVGDDKTPEGCQRMLDELRRRCVERELPFLGQETEIHRLTREFPKSILHLSIKGPRVDLQILAFAAQALPIFIGAMLDTLQRGCAEGSTLRIVELVPLPQFGTQAPNRGEDRTPRFSSKDLESFGFDPNAN